MSFSPLRSNARPQRERPSRIRSVSAESQEGRDALQGRDTHPGLLRCTVQRYGGCTQKFTPHEGGL
jgi:hypothetical protein